MSIPQAVLPPPPLEQWQNFFDVFRQFPIEEETPQKTFIPNKLATEAFFTGFREQYSAFVKDGGTINVWEIAKLRSDEVQNCAVLAWLLDCHGSHAQGDFFLKCLLDCLKGKPMCSGDIGSNYKTSVEQNYENAGQCEAQSNNRVDIVVESEKFLLFIEVKINACEGYEQLQRYSDALNARKKSGALVFLTRSDALPEKSKSLTPQPLPLSWHTLATSFEKAMKAHVSSTIYGTANQPLWAALAQQFCHHVKKF